MKAVILAGGLGTRISEETHLKPKPMIEIGGMPILWHIMKGYSSYGVNDFIICCGYKGFLIKEYFSNYFLHRSDVTIDLQANDIEIHENFSEPWKITLVDTGPNTMTGGRLKRIKHFLKDEDAFCFTYGDGVSDINIKNLIDFHNSHNKLATITGVVPPGRYGAIIGDGDAVKSFEEKPQGDGAIINGGFFVLSPSVIDLIDGDETSWELEPLLKLVDDDNLMVFRHDGFWQPMDTLRDKNYLEELWATNPPWKSWS